MVVSGALAYRKLSTTTDVENANPHRLIQLLLDGAVEKINKAKYFMSNKMIAEKGEYISWSISIIGGLQASLDKEKGGEIAENLDRLYDFCSYHLALANMENSTSKLDDVLNVMNQIREGWAGIKAEAEKL